MNNLHMRPARDEWEDWSDGDDPLASMARNDSSPHSTSADTLSRSKSSSQSTRRSKVKITSSKIQRLKSRKRQKHQNEKLGISLVTDMTRFRKGPHHVAQLVQPSSGPVSSEANINKFADASALRALEGSPNLASVGNWAWLKGNGSQSPASTATPGSQHFSPDGSKIVIGMAMAEQDAADRIISPSTATVATPTTRFPHLPRSTQPAIHHQNSTWSPDTEDGYSPARHRQQNMYGQSIGQGSAHPMPAVPSHFKNSTKATDVDDDDDFTPVTLFEEDGRKSPTSAVSKISPESTRSRSGWWDHVKTPFKERFSPSPNFPTSPDEWWKAADNKAANVPQQYTASHASSPTLRPIIPIIREPSPIPSSSRSTPAPSLNEQRQEARSEKAGVVTEEHADTSDVPPPYEHTPSSKQDVRYHFVLPKNHYLATQFPASTVPESPGLAMNMSDVPLTPARVGAASTHSADAPLPDRVAGTYVGDHHQQVRGDSPAAQIEKTRRRHEKEDYLARKLGGFGRGRVCLTGCYGRSGREGRQRRRCWLIGCLIFLALVIIGVVVGVVVPLQLRQKAAAAAAAAAPSTTSSASGFSATSIPDTTSSNTPEQSASVWLNLTSFPPIPTGLSTVVGPDNTEAISGCVAPETLWSCSLPPEEQAANKPSEADQPMFIFQIQYDNSTRKLWDIPNGDAPAPAASTTTLRTMPSSTTSASSQTTLATSSAASAAVTNDLFGSDPGRRLARRDDELYDTGIAPNPVPPSFDEMWFLGNWTDGIESANKSGEPTPFYISFFTSLNSTAGANALNGSSPSAKRRGAGVGLDSSESIGDLLPAPLLNADGTGQPAQLRPFPFQQPLRLFDRGLPTEHYGFYSYFNKTIYVASMANTSTATSANEGGVRETSAAWYATWTQTRFVVKIWTRKDAAAVRLIAGAGGNTTAPGTFPYPLTVREDTHGGDLQLKQTFAYGVEADQVVNTTRATTFINDIGFGAAVVNAANPDGDLSWGGTDGGAGGCRCEWVNWVDDA